MSIAAHTTLWNINKTKTPRASSRSVQITDISRTANTARLAAFFSVIGMARCLIKRFMQVSSQGRKWADPDGVHFISPALKGVNGWSDYLILQDAECKR